MEIPELELELASGTLGGLVTTVEGLISKIGESKFFRYHFSRLIILVPSSPGNVNIIGVGCTNLIIYLSLSFSNAIIVCIISSQILNFIIGLERVHGFTFGDSMDDAKRSKWKDFRSKIEQVQILKHFKHYFPMLEKQCCLRDKCSLNLDFYPFELCSVSLIFETIGFNLQLKSLEEPWTLILDDALSNSFIAPVTDEMKEDSQLSCKFVFILYFLSIL